MGFSPCDSCTTGRTLPVAHSPHSDTRVP
ncbi:hypothetical protein PHL009M11_43 [Propionibacterium phage PHL009M11]|uniref:Uncharacterized protein n=1 Tax=Propionibacterium phage PHL009M11 TaxID=1500798 RepID=A0A0E3DL11_9CAUD|nr:hypothetical protein ACQ85_gp43 [Propionibacterium phage PHL009M11]AII28626.1 hypothetical protein PHL009M11_43 [Propionibacterium phage PHL009M11]